VKRRKEGNIWKYEIGKKENEILKEGLERLEGAAKEERHSSPRKFKRLG